ncbi:HEPN domain-containing protein [Bradyrhizobium sp. HKCCYLS2058]|uniref:HEPN domain-containing protein n=1 Tax=unclassified Bradyrhizobium TaxID=2631580 RepID=UPI003EB9D5F4
MLDAISSYRANIARVQSLGGLNAALGTMVTDAIDLSDILRAGHVLAVSALDHFVHEAVRIGMLEVFDGKRAMTPAYARFRVPLDALSANAAITRANFEDEIRSQHSFQSFQHPDRLADAFRLVTEIKLWDALGDKLGRPAKDLKDALRLVVDRRNKIAHEADVDPTYPNARWPITIADLNSTIDFTNGIVEGIYDLVHI